MKTIGFTLSINQPGIKKYGISDELMHGRERNQAYGTAKQREKT